MAPWLAAFWLQDPQPTLGGPAQHKGGLAHLHSKCFMKGFHTHAQENIFCQKERLRERITLMILLLIVNTFESAILFFMFWSQ